VDRFKDKVKQTKQDELLYNEKFAILQTITWIAFCTVGCCSCCQRHVWVK